MYPTKSHTQDENIMGLMNMGKQQSLESVVPRSEIGNTHEPDFDRQLSPKAERMENNPVKDQQINELSEMVKELLREQQDLKEQLKKQEQTKHSNSIPGKINHKKASERVPRT